MKTRVFLLILAMISYAVHSRAQQVTIQDIHIQYVGRDSLWLVDFNYPFVVSDNKQAQDSINFVLIYDITQTDSLHKIDSNAVRKILKAEDNDAMVNVEYSVTLKTEKLLGIDLLVEWSGAYPYNTLSRFMFDLENGRRLTLADITRKDMAIEFSSVLYNACTDSLNAHILYLINEAVVLQIDSSEIDDIIQIVVECRDKMQKETMLETSDFYFEGNRLLVAGSCWFPHAVMVYQPFFNIPFKLSSIQQVLKPEIYSQLIAQKTNK